MSTPHVHVVRGTPDDDELAALVAGLVATARPDDPPDGPEHAAAWTDRRRSVRPTPAQVPGPSTWRWSLHP